MSISAITASLYNPLPAKKAVPALRQETGDVFVKRASGDVGPIRFGQYADKQGRAHSSLGAHTLEAQDIERLMMQLQLARALHGQQAFRGSVTPFILHSIGVLSNVMELASPSTYYEQLAAIGHDGIEDQPENYKRLKQQGQIPPVVDALVRLCSQDSSESSSKLRKYQFVATLGERFDQAVSEMQNLPAYKGHKPLSEKQARTSAIVVLAADKLDGMMRWHQEMQGYGTAFITSGEKMRFLKSYYYELTKALWEQSDKAGSPPRIQPLLRNLTESYMSFAETVDKMFPEGRQIIKPPSEETLRQSLEDSKPCMRDWKKVALAAFQ